MNKKGFTLTELIAILVVISIRALIAVPAVVNSIKNNNHDNNVIIKHLQPKGVAVPYV